MTTKADANKLSKALQWVRDTPVVRQAAIEAATMPNMTLPDSMMADPLMIIKGAEAALAIAREHGAKEETLSTLEAMTRQYRANAKSLKEIDYAVGVVRGLQGLRDRAEMEGPLAAALAGAPDEVNRAKLAHIVATVHQPPSSDLGSPPVAMLRNEGDLDCPWGCCLFTCILCTIDCVGCCIAACVLCGSSPLRWTLIRES